jgi:hypothetical protein
MVYFAYIRLLENIGTLIYEDHFNYYFFNIHHFLRMQ